MRALRWVARVVALAFAVPWALGVIEILRLPPLEPLAGVGNRPDVAAQVDAPADRPLRIAFVGDVNNMGVANLGDVLRREDVGRSDLVLFGGDMIHGDGTGWKHRFTLGEMRRSGPLPPAFVAPGNHDVEPTPDGFQRAYGELNFTLRAGPARIVVLDSNAPDDAMARTLREATADRFPGEPVVVVFHIPLEPEKPDRPEFHRALGELAEPLVVLCGHWHGYWEREIDGHPHIVTGGRARHAWGEPGRPLTLLTVEAGRITWTSPEVELPDPVVPWVRFGLIRNVEKVLRGEKGGWWAIAWAVFLWGGWLLVEVLTRRRRRSPQVAPEPAEDVAEPLQPPVGPPGA